MSKRKPGGKLNALRDGIFAKELIITSAGETQEEFDQLRSRLRKDFAPRDVVQEMVVEQLATIYWRLQRPRRCEAAEIRKQLETALYRKQLQRMEELETRKNTFFVARYRLLEPNLPGAERLDLERSLAEARRALKRTPEGVEFLIRNLETVKLELKIRGYLAPHQETLMWRVCGLEADHLHGFHQLNQLAKKERLKKQPADNDKVNLGTRSTAEEGADAMPAEERPWFMVAPKRDAPVERGEENTNPISEAEKLARDREFDQSYKASLEEHKNWLKQILLDTAREQNAAETGANANVMGQDFEALRMLYLDVDEMVEDIELREQQQAERAAENSNENAKPSPGDEHQFVLWHMLDGHIRGLKQTKIQLELLEAAEESTQPASLLLLPPEFQDRIHRAEVPLQRHFLKLLQLLYALEGIA